MATKTMSTFDKETLYNEKILPLVRELLISCNEARLPVFVSVCVSNDDTSTAYMREAITPQSHNLGLADNRILKYLAIDNGCGVTVPPETDIIDLDKLI